jgi:hypothetical protein
MMRHSAASGRGRGGHSDSRNSPSVKRLNIALCAVKSKNSMIRTLLDNDALLDK